MRNLIRFPAKSIRYFSLVLSLVLTACESGGDLNFQQTVRQQEDLINLAIQNSDVCLHDSGLSILAQQANFQATGRAIHELPQHQPYTGEIELKFDTALLGKVILEIGRLSLGSLRTMMGL